MRFTKAIQNIDLQFEMFLNKCEEQATICTLDIALYDTPLLLDMSCPLHGACRHSGSDKLQDKLAKY